MSRYRYRTHIRTILPIRLGWLAPKGKKNCGDHEWYFEGSTIEDGATWRCYHCEYGVSHRIPWDEREYAARLLEAEAMRIRAGLSQ